MSKGSGVLKLLALEGAIHLVLLHQGYTFLLARFTFVCCRLD